jgi:hypothetical protein
MLKQPNRAAQRTAKLKELAAERTEVQRRFLHTQREIKCLLGLNSTPKDFAAVSIAPQEDDGPQPRQNLLSPHPSQPVLSTARPRSSLKKSRSPVVAKTPKKLKFIIDSPVSASPSYSQLHRRTPKTVQVSLNKGY